MRKRNWNMETHGLSVGAVSMRFTALQVSECLDLWIQNRNTVLNKRLVTMLGPNNAN